MLAVVRNRLVFVLMSVLVVSSCSFYRGVALLDGKHLEIASEAPANSDTLTVAFFGVSTLLFTDGQTTLLVDGFFSRPPKSKLLLDLKISPDIEKITNTIERFKIKDVDAILVGHSHYDHAMDTGIVSAIAGGDVLGSESTMNIVRGTSMAFPDFAVPESRLVKVNNKENKRYGAFNVTFHESKHFDLRLRREKLIGTTIDAPLRLPADITDYGEGTTWSIHISHPQGTAIVQPSAGYLDGALNGVSADVAFLGVSTPFKSDPASMARYWQEVVEQTGAKVIYPIHWDDPTLPLNAALRTTPELIDNIAETIDTLKAIAVEQGRDMKLLPVAKAVSMSTQNP